MELGTGRNSPPNKRGKGEDDMFKTTDKQGNEFIIEPMEVRDELLAYFMLKPTDDDVAGLECMISVDILSENINDVLINEGYTRAHK